MAEVASAFVSVVPSARGFGKKLDSQVGPDLDKSGKAGGKRFSAGFGSAFKAAIGPALAVIGAAAVGGLLKGAIDEASDLGETMNKSNVIFGKSAKDIEAFGNRAAKSIGLSKSEAVAAAAGFGDMFSQIGFSQKAAAKMSKSTIQMAADLGSFNNLETSDVTDRLSAAFRGEYDSLQAVIPNINAARVESEALAKTGKKTAKELTAQEKAAAVLAIVHKDGARAMGDFKRTSGGLANQQKILSAQTKDLKAKLGAALLPIVTKIATFLNDKAVPAIEKFIGQMKDGTGAGGKVADAFQKVGDALGAVFDFISNNKAVVATFVGVVVSLTAAFAAMNIVLAINPITLVVLAIAALAAGFVYAYKHSETFRDVVDGVWSFLKPFATWLADKIPGALKTLGLAFLTMAQVGIKANHFLLNAILTVFSGIINGAAKAFGWVPGLGPKIKAAAKGFDAMKDAVDAALDEVEAKIADTKAGLDGLGKKKPKPTVTLGGYGTTVGRITGIQAGLGKLDKVHATPSIELAGAARVGAQIGDIAGKLGGLSVKAQGIKIPGNAKGTDNWQGGLTWVGEKGPELINLAKGAQVIPNHKIGSVTTGSAIKSSGGGDRPIVMNGSIVGVLRNEAELVFSEQSAFTSTLDRMSA